MHVGIVACSAEGAALCYRTMCERDDRRTVTMHGEPFDAYVRALNAGDWNAVAELMLRSAQKLAAAGAQVLVCPDNTIHAAFDLVAPRSPVPWLHIAEVVAAEASRRGFHTVGILGTRWLVESDVYPEKLRAGGLGFRRPAPGDIAEIHRIIMNELVHGVFKPEAIAYHQAVIARLGDAGCDAVVLGCTEIPLIVTDANSPLPVLDSTRLLAKAAVEWPKK